MVTEPSKYHTTVWNFSLQSSAIWLSVTRLMFPNTSKEQTSCSFHGHSDDTALHVRGVETCHNTVTKNIKADLWVAYVGYPIINRMSWMWWSNKHQHTFWCSSLRLAFGYMYSTTWDSEMMVMPFTSITLLHAEYFYAHWHIITCQNKHNSRKGNLQTVTS